MFSSTEAYAVLLVNRCYIERYSAAFSLKTMVMVTAPRSFRMFYTASYFHHWSANQSLVLDLYLRPCLLTISFVATLDLGAEMGAVTSYIYGIVRAGVLNDPFFSAARYNTSLLSSADIYIWLTIFLDWYMKGPTFPDIPIYMYLSLRDFSRLLVLLVLNELTVIFV